MNNEINDINLSQEKDLKHFKISCLIRFIAVLIIFLIITLFSLVQLGVFDYKYVLKLDRSIGVEKEYLHYCIAHGDATSEEIQIHTEEKLEFLKDEINFDSAVFFLLRSFC
ncbi:MAG: hypothetical protein K0R54_802 [Clostridiaceae bacterium]|jgi:hypothetical protein|nr:hypothetical protein [Clostridiaceae bacterium]